MNSYQEMIKKEHEKRSEIAKKNSRKIGKLKFAQDAIVTMRHIVTQAGYTIRTIAAVKKYKKARPDKYGRAYAKRKARIKKAKESRRINRKK